MAEERSSRSRDSVVFSHAHRCIGPALAEDEEFRDALQGSKSLEVGFWFHVGFSTDSCLLGRSAWK